jgi:hypothetical protein
MQDTPKFAGHTLGQLNSPYADEQVDQVRVFDDFSARISVAHDAVSVAQKDLTVLRERLGIPSMYGCAVVGMNKATDGGQVSAIRQQLDALCELAREVRGIAETLNEKL